MNKIAKYLLCFSVGVICLGLTACKKDDANADIKDLFTPVMVKTSSVTYPVIKINTAQFVWYAFDSAVSYDIQISTKSDFSDNIVVSQTVTNAYCTIKNLPYATKLYYRIRANAQEEKYSSSWFVSNFTTGPRQIIMILKSIDKAADLNSEDNSVILRWSVDEKNPVTAVQIEAPSIPGSKQFVQLTPDEAAQGYYKFIDLSPNTNYLANVLDTNKESPVDQPYNEVAFRSAGAPANAIRLELTDNIGQILKDNDGNTAIPSGQVYYLPAGYTCTYTGAITITKGFSIIGDAGGVRPRWIMSGTGNGLVFSGSVGDVSFEGVDLEGGAYFSNTATTGAAYSIDNLEFEDCNFTGYTTTFFRTQGTSKISIGKISINNCIFFKCGGATSSYGQINFGGAVGSTESVNEISITNTTMINSMALLVLGYVSPGAQIGGTKNITIANLTVFNPFPGNSGKTFINTKNIPNAGTASMKGVLFGGAAPGKDSWQKGGYVPVLEGIYRTPEAQEGSSSPIPADLLNISDANLFVNPNTNPSTISDVDLTIKDLNCVIYTMRYGDPRWIK